MLGAVLAEPLPQPVADLVANEGITVLAPTNSAIEALPTWGDIVGDAAALQQFLLAHILPGQVDEAEMFATTQVTALSGDVLQIDAATQTINGAHLVVIDQLGSNGIAHSVDAVLVVPTAAPAAVEPPPPTEPPATAAPATIRPAPATEPPLPTPPATTP